MHAFFQVVHVDLPRARVRTSMHIVSCRSTSNYAVGYGCRSERVSDDFHARFSATWREYRYLVFEGDAPGLR